MMEKITSIPDAVRTLRGLSHQGYTPQTAVADILDNSIAAGATKLSVQFVSQPDESHVVNIADNGCGMDGETLVKAMQIGSSDTLARSSLSVYGMGLKAASMSFTRRFSVISKTATSAPVMASWDLDAQVDDPWTILFGSPEASDLKRFDRLVPGESGTLVTWERADFRDVVLDFRKIKGTQPSGKTKNTVEKTTREYLAMVFHRFMEGTAANTQKVEISFNSEQLLPYNPVKTEFLSSTVAPIRDDFSIEVATESGVEEVPYSITTYVLGQGEEQVDEANLGMRTQGVYPYRHDRLLQSPDWLGVITFHPDWNPIRVVLELDRRLDSITKTDMKKSGLSLPPEMLQNIKEKLDEYSRRVRREAKRKKAIARSQIDTSKIHTDSNKSISEASEYVNKAQVNFTDQGATVSTLFGDSLTDLVEIVNADYGSESRIETVESLGADVLFEPRWNGNEPVIFINKSHPFYQKVYLGVIGDPLAIQGMDFLIYSMCQAELLTRTDRALDQFRRMRIEMSEALRSFVAEIDDPGSSLERELDSRGEEFGV